MTRSTEVRKPANILHREPGAEKLKRTFIGPLKGNFLASVLLLAMTLSVAAPAFGWEYWGGDAGGTRF